MENRSLVFVAARSPIATSISPSPARQGLQYAQDASCFLRTVRICEIRIFSLPQRDCLALPYTWRHYAMLDLVRCDGSCESGSEGGHNGAAPSPSCFEADQGSCSYTERECFRLLRARGGGASGGCRRQWLPRRSPLPALARFSRTYPIGSPSLHSASCASGQRRQ